MLLGLLFVAVTAIANAQQTMPNDSDRYHLVTVVANPPTPAGHALLQSLQSHPQLIRISVNCKRFDFTPDDVLYQERYAAAMPPIRLPAVALVRFDGGVIYKASGPDVPLGDDLAEALMRMGTADRAANPRIQEVRPAGDCPDGNCPRQPPYLPDRRPRPAIDGSQMIPDTVVIQPEFGIPPAFGYIALAIVIFIVTGSLGVVAIAGVLFGAMVLFRQ